MISSNSKSDKAVKDYFLSGNLALTNGEYFDAALLLIQAFRAEGPSVTKSSSLALLLLALEHLHTQFEDSEALFNSSDDLLEKIGLDDKELRRLAKSVSSHSRNKLYSRIVTLAESDLIDPYFVAKQLGKKSICKYQAAFDFYTQSHSRVQPNIFFNSAYYRAVNDLPNDTDSVEHYFKIGALKRFATHRLLDFDWLLKKSPEIMSSSCPVSYYWSHCYKLGILPCNPDNLPGDFINQYFFFLQNTYPELSYSYEKNISYDRTKNEDLMLLSEYDDKLEHFKNFFSSIESLPYLVPIDFDALEYIDIHKDLNEAFSKSPLDSLGHYLRHGISEGRPYNFQDIFIPRFKQTKVFDNEKIKDIKDKKPICVLMHLYYIDLWDELKRYVENISVDFDLCINLVDSTWDPNVVQSIRNSYPNALIKISPNEGRDIGGYISLLHDIDLDDYMSVVVMHSKKSQHISEKHMITWRTNLLDAILGSKEIVNNNLAALVSSEKIGIVGSAQHKETDMGKNSDMYEQLLDHFGIADEHRDCEYVSGTMMMMRSEIMSMIYEKVKPLSFNNADNKGLDFLIDGQLEHAIERVFGNVMKQLGYKYYWS